MLDGKARWLGLKRFRAPADLGRLKVRYLPFGAVDEKSWRDIPFWGKFPRAPAGASRGCDVLYFINTEYVSSKFGGT